MGMSTLQNAMEVVSRLESASRRAVLLGGVALAWVPTLVAEAAEPKHAAPGKAAGHGAAKKLDPGAPVVPTGTPADSPLGPIDTPAKWALIIDYNTGATLLSKDADVPMAPSSLTKLMTAYIVFAQLKASRISLTQDMPVSEKAWRMGGSKMFVPLGGSITVEELIRGMIIQSGNDACIVLAEGISGSEEQFVEAMNQKAKAMGLTNSVFRNSTGWPDPEHHMSCRDIATLAHHLIEDFPEYYHYFSEKSFKFNNIDQENRNPAVQRGLADGLKTGHTDEGGFGECASSLRNGRRVILVLNGMTSMHQRAAETERLLEWSFANFENVTLFTAADVVERAPVWLGTSANVPLVGGRDLQVTMPRNWQRRAQVAISYNVPIRAPVARGTTVGQISISGDGVPDLTMPLLAGADVDRLGLPGRALAVLSHYVVGG
jgi:D-alanyl-D-alanine carboxypeptidase (penicillin-binding protein 5/6)